MVIRMSIGHSSSAYSLLVAEAQRQGHGGGHNDRLPAPEVEPAQRVAVHARLAQPLQRIINAAEHAVAHKRENDRVGMERPNAPKGGKRRIQVQIRPEQLAGRQQARAGANQPPERGGDGKGPDNVIVVAERFDRRAAAARGLCAGWGGGALTHGFAWFDGCEGDGVFPGFWSSDKIRIAGVQVSSY